MSDVRFCFYWSKTKDVGLNGRGREESGPKFCMLMFSNGNKIHADLPRCDSVHLFLNGLVCMLEHIA